MDQYQIFSWQKKRDGMALCKPWTLCFVPQSKQKAMRVNQSVLYENIMSLAVNQLLAFQHITLEYSGDHAVDFSKRTHSFSDGLLHFDVSFREIGYGEVSIHVSVHHRFCVNIPMYARCQGFLERKTGKYIMDRGSNRVSLRMQGCKEEIRKQEFENHIKQVATSGYVIPQGFASTGPFIF